MDKVTCPHRSVLVERQLDQARPVLKRLSETLLGSLAAGHALIGKLEFPQDCLPHAQRLGERLNTTGRDRITLLGEGGGGVGARVGVGLGRGLGQGFEGQVVGEAWSDCW